MPRDVRGCFIEVVTFLLVLKGEWDFTQLRRRGWYSRKRGQQVQV